MKLLANENFPKASVLLLRSFSYNVTYVAEDNAGIKDTEVMETGQSEQRLIVTFDRDYGELIFKHNYKPEQGVLYLRLSEYSPVQPAIIVHELLTVFKLETYRRLTVYDGQTIRQRKY